MTAAVNGRNGSRGDGTMASCAAARVHDCGCCERCCCCCCCCCCCLCCSCCCYPQLVVVADVQHLQLWTQGGQRCEGGRGGQACGPDRGKQALVLEVVLTLILRAGAAPGTCLSVRPVRVQLAYGHKLPKAAPRHYHHLHPAGNASCYALYKMAAHEHNCLSSQPSPVPQHACLCWPRAAS